MSCKVLSLMYQEVKLAGRANPMPTNDATSGTSAGSNNESGRSFRGTPRLFFLARTRANKCLVKGPSSVIALKTLELMQEKLDVFQKTFGVFS